MNGEPTFRSELVVRAVEPAGCLDHADVVLSGPEGEVRRRIDSPLGRAIHAELAGVPSEYAVFIDLLKAVLAAHGSAFSHVLLSGGARATGAIVLSGAGDATGVRGLPQGVPLLVAARLRLPVRIVAAQLAPHQENVPEPFRRFLEELSLQGLERQAPRSDL